MSKSEPAPNWRNFAAWSVIGAAFYGAVLWGFVSLTSGDSLWAVLQSREVAPIIGLGLAVSMATTGFTGRKRRISLRTVRNFVIRDAVAVAVCLLLLWGLISLARYGALGVSEWAAAATGAGVIFFAVLGALATASVRTGADLIDDEMASEDMRDRGRLFFLNFLWMGACGLLLVMAGLAGSGGLLPPTAALAGALVLIVLLTGLGLAVWRLTDELDRTLSYEAGNMAFYLVLAVGGGWAMLAHLDFVEGPAPLDWLTMLTVLMFTASIIAVARRKLLMR